MIAPQFPYFKERIKAPWALSLILLFLASVVDELIATVLLLEIDSETGLWPSILFAITTAGSLLAGPLSRHILLEGRSLTRILSVILLCEAISLLPCIYFYKQAEPIVTVVVGGFLGVLGGALWVVVLLIVAESFENHQFDSVNKWVTTVRNAGFVAGPALGGLLYPIGSIYIYLGSIALCLISALFTLKKVPSIVCPTTEKNQEELDIPYSAKKRFSSSVVELLKLPGLAIRLIPPMGVAFFGSVVNVGIVLYLLNMQGRTASDYGLVGASISVGLVLGPVLMEAITKNKSQIGIGLSGIVTGIAIIALFQPWDLLFTMFSGLLLGIGNGGQNVFVTSLLMKSVPKGKRTSLIPAFVFCIYFFVFVSYVAGLFVTQSNVLPFMICGGVITILLGFFSLTRRQLFS
jgi:Major Facilitator Superfamily.